MNLRGELDALYLAFCETLPTELRLVGRQLPYCVKLAPKPDMPWSQVLAHEVTFAAPALFAQALPGITPGQVRDSFLAHALAVIEAFGTDRVEDGQTAESPELRMVLERLRLGRDRALACVYPIGADRELDYVAASAEVLESQAIERELMAAGASVDFARYEAIARGKASV